MWRHCLLCIQDYLRKSSSMDFVLDQEFIDQLKKHNIYQTRTGMARKFQDPVYRWKVGDKISFLKSTSIEEFTTFASGYCLFTCGAFSALASDFGINASVGRYCEFATGSSRMGFRHPIESVCINSAVFNFYRENIYSYFNQYENFNKIKLVKNSVPTPQPQAGIVIIGHDVWIGNNVKITGGITIGTGSVIASNSIVTKDVLPYSIVAGSPAKIKKFRFPPDVIHGMIESNWWNYELGDMLKEGLDFANPGHFLKKFFVVKNNLRLLDIKTFRPAEYIIKRNIKQKNLVCTHFSSVMLFDYECKTLVHKKISEANKLTFVEAIINSKKICFRVGEKYIQSINVFGKCEIQNNIKFFDFKQDDFIIYIYIDNQYLSARENGSFSLVNIGNEWEQFIIS